ncbi:hypothetical protein MASR1M6_27000 [Rubrivivax sp.]
MTGAAELAEHARADEAGQQREDGQHDQQFDQREAGKAAAAQGKRKKARWA